MRTAVTTRSARSSGLDQGVAGILIVSLLALVGRVLYVLTVTRHGDLGMEGDAFSYNAVAGNLGPGHWFVDPFTGRPIADHPPLTVLALGPVDAVFDSITAQRLAMAVIGSVAVLLIGLAGCRVAGARAGVLAAGIAALNPNLWVNDGLLMSESLSTVMIAGLILAGCWLHDSPTPRRAMAVGALCGLAILTRAELALFVPFMVVPILWSTLRRSPAALFGRVAAAVLLTVLVVVPWSAWNTSRFEDPILVSTNDGTVLVGANCDETYEGAGLGGWSFTCVAAVPVEGFDASQAARVQRAAGVDYVRSHLGRVPLVVAAREARSVGLVTPAKTAVDLQREGRRPAVTWLAFAAFWLLAIPSALGARMLYRRRVTVIPFVACVLTSVSVVAVTQGSPRLHLPVDVAMCVLAAVALADWTAHAGSTTASSRSSSDDPPVEPVAE